MTFAPASLAWFAQHELRLNWRDTIAMLSGGRRGRLAGFVIGGLIVYAVVALIAWFAVRPWVTSGVVLDKSTLMLVTGMGSLFWIVTLSQALEAVTRVYYSRSDLDLILSSPASSRLLFAVHAGAVALSTALLGIFLISPMIVVLVLQLGPQWLAAFLVLAGLACLSTTIAMLLTQALFHAVGPRKTRLIAQILAAIIGAGFAIGIQGAAILSHEGFSRMAMFQSAGWIEAAPDMDSVLWIPARAAMGDMGLSLLILALGIGSLVLATMVTAPSYARLATAAAGLSHIRSQRRNRGPGFAPLSQRQALRRKEWRLLQRDPWLLSQTLMQLLYLLPPALLLWVSYGSDENNYIVIVAVLVMAAGQLAGGLAWLAISGEDAHDLVATAPLPPRTILRAKVEAVLVVIGVILAPILIFFAFASWRMALITAICVAISASASTAIQLWFRVTAKRSMFRRRQVASRAATLCEAFSSIMWAGTAALLASNPIFAILPATVAIAVLGLARFIAPKAH